MSFNDSRVVAALNSLTVPLYLSNDLVVGAERQELTRIHREGLIKKLSVGTVHCFLLSHDGAVLDTIHVAQASPTRILTMLESAAKLLALPPGKTLIPTRSLELPLAPASGQRLHVVTRYLERKPDGTLGLVTGAGGNWSALPGEDWPVFTATELLALRRGDRAIAERLVTHFYPPTENNDLSKNVVEALEWKTQPLSRGRVQITGNLTLKHPFHSRDDNWRASAAFIGYASEQTFEMVTTRAEYGKLPFAVAVTRD